MAQSDNEWEDRTLCSDGNCIGVIGADGRCKVCGLSYEGTLPAPGDEAPADGEVADDFPADPPETSDADGDDGPPVAPEDDEDWEGRTLCIDESCIGVVGPDGRCKECGKPQQGSRS